MSSEVAQMQIASTTTSVAMVPMGRIVNFTPEEQVNESMMQELLQGVARRLVIVHRLGCGKQVMFRNENFVKIEDPLQLYKAHVVFFTNDDRPGALGGNILFDAKVNIQGSPSRFNSLTFVYQSGRTYEFTDQSSFYYWSGQCLDLSIARLS
jgi:hypothetical protein